MAQDDKKFCLLHFVSREPYVIWLSFMLLHLCYSCVKWHIQEFFSFFQSFDFWDCYGGKRTKNSPKWQNSVCCTWYLRNNTSCNCHLWYTSIKWYLQVFLFFKILILGVVWRVKGQKMAQNDKKLCPLHFKSQEPYMIWSWFRIHMCKRIMSPGGFYIFSQF